MTPTSPPTGSSKHRRPQWEHAHLPVRPTHDTDRLNHRNTGASRAVGHGAGVQTYGIVVVTAREQSLSRMGLVSIGFHSSVIVCRSRVWSNQREDGGMPRMVTAVRDLTSAGLPAACAHRAGSTSASSSSRAIPTARAAIIAGDTAATAVSRSGYTSRSSRSATPTTIYRNGLIALAMTWTFALFIAGSVPAQHCSGSTCRIVPPRRSHPGRSTTRVSRRVPGACWCSSVLLEPGQKGLGVASVDAGAQAGRKAHGLVLDAHVLDGGHRCEGEV